MLSSSIDLLGIGKSLCVVRQCHCQGCILKNVVIPSFYFISNNRVVHYSSLTSSSTPLSLTAIEGEMVCLAAIQLEEKYLACATTQGLSIVMDNTVPNPVWNSALNGVPICLSAVSLGKDNHCFLVSCDDSSISLITSVGCNSFQSKSLVFLSPILFNISSLRRYIENDISSSVRILSIYVGYGGGFRCLVFGSMCGSITVIKTAYENDEYLPSKELAYEFTINGPVTCVSFHMQLSKVVACSSFSCVRLIDENIPGIDIFDCKNNDTILCQCSFEFANTSLLVFGSYGGDLFIFTAHSQPKLLHRQSLGCSIFEIENYGDRLLCSTAQGIIAIRFLTSSILSVLRDRLEIYIRHNTLSRYLNSDL